MQSKIIARFAANTPAPTTAEEEGEEDAKADECTSMAKHIIDCVYSLQQMLESQSQSLNSAKRGESLDSNNNNNNNSSSNNASATLCKFIMADLVKFVISTVTGGINANAAQESASSSSSASSPSSHQDDFFKVSRHILQSFPSICANSHLLHLSCKYASGSLSSAHESISMILSLDPKQATFADDSGRFALHYIVQNKHVGLETIKLVFEANKSAISTPDRNGLLPLHLAVMELGSGCGSSSNVASNNINPSNPYLEIIDYLIQLFPAATNFACKKGRLPLHFAVSIPSPDYKVVSSLISVNPNSLNMSCKMGWLPLHRLLAKSDVDIDLLKLLLSGTIRASNSQTPKSNLPQYSSRRKANQLASQKLRKNILSCKITNNGQLPLHIYCDVSAPNVKIVTYLIESYPDSVLALDSNYYLPIHIAADKKNPVYKLIWTLLLKPGSLGIKSVKVGVPYPHIVEAETMEKLVGAKEKDLSAIDPILKSAVDSSSSTKGSSLAAALTGVINTVDRPNDDTGISDSIPMPISTPAAISSSSATSNNIGKGLVSSKQKSVDGVLSTMKSPLYNTSSSTASFSSFSHLSKSRQAVVSASINAPTHSLYLLHLLVGVAENVDLELCKLVAALYPDSICCYHQCQDCAVSAFYEDLDKDKLINFLLDRFYDVKYEDTDLLEAIGLSVVRGKNQVGEGMPLSGTSTSSKNINVVGRNDLLPGGGGGSGKLNRSDSLPLLPISSLSTSLFSAASSNRPPQAPIPSSALGEFRNALLKSIYDTFKSDSVFYTKSNISTLSPAMLQAKKDELRPTLDTILQQLIDKKTTGNGCVGRRDPLIFTPYKKAVQLQRLKLVREFQKILEDEEYRLGIVKQWCKVGVHVDDDDDDVDDDVDLDKRDIGDNIHK